MAEKSDPSIYDDRTTIGSSDELDEYGVWVKSEPQDLSASLPDIEPLSGADEGLGDLPDFSDFSDFTDPPAGGETTADPADSTETPAPDLEFEELPESSELPQGPAPSGVDKDGFTEVSMNDFLDSGDAMEPEAIDFGDLDSSIPEAEPAAPDVLGGQGETDRAGDVNLSNQLLMKIADELSSIKKELSSLKTELSAVKGEGRVKSAESPEAKGGGGGGFFDEEDDEKIALTGDELDNILNTANFTEEAGSDEGLDGGDAGLSFDLGESAEAPAEDSLSGGDILSEDGSVDISFDDSDISELNGAIKVEDDLKNLGDLSMDGELPDFGEESELDAIREEGAVPVTPPPEDTSYLEDDPLAPEAGDGEHIDLSGAIIDEPDLSAQIQENPVSEPALDNISIDLDMEESIPGEAPAGSDDFVFETEETIEIPGGEAPLAGDTAPDDLSFDSGSSEDISFDSGIPASEDLSFDDLSGGDLSGGGLDLPVEETPEAAAPPSAETAAGGEAGAEDGIPSNLKQELKTVLSYMDQLLESLPEDKIEEFAKSEYFDTYKKLFEELGLV
ncbi:MAG: hypothetical protein LBD09_07300 [Treponema sp.]|jgi:hypothetical protein|nr:hypothetical protein [Treponema sp.]